MIKDHVYHAWLIAQSDKTQDLIDRLKDKRKEQGWLLDGTTKLLLDKIDELARIRWLIARVEEGAMEAELAYPNPRKATDHGK